jgi:hypothetical protein
LKLGHVRQQAFEDFECVPFVNVLHQNIEVKFYFLGLLRHIAQLQAILANHFIHEVVGLEHHYLEEEILSNVHIKGNK